MLSNRRFLLGDYDLLTLRGFVTFQLLLLANALAVGGIFLLLRGSADLLEAIIYTVVAGNVVGLLMSWSAPLYDRSFPHNWIIYIVLLLPVALLASVTGALALSFALAIPARIRLSFIRANVPFGTLISLISGLLLYAFISTRNRMLRDNQQLAQQVHRGEQEIASHASELRAAFEIQSSLLPSTIPQIAGLDMSCAWQPARTVSGDFFDVLVLGESRVGVCLADVSGKGISAALLTAHLQSSFRAFAGDEASPARLCHRLNQALCGSLPTGRFVTFAYGIVDRASLSLTYALAGHPPPLLLRDGQRLTLAEGGAVLGILPEAAYQDHLVRLRPGDRLVLATDGVTEAFNAVEEEFGEHRLLAAASAPALASAHAVQTAVLAEVSHFTAGHFQDDASLVVVLVKP